MLLTLAHTVNDGTPRGSGAAAPVSTAVQYPAWQTVTFLSLLLVLLKAMTHG